MVTKPGQSQFTTFTPYKVNVRTVEFDGNPPALSAFPEWVWYTPAPLFLWGGLGHKILSEMQTSLGLEYYQATFNTQIFSGLDWNGDSFWNHTLWAVEQTQWSKFKTELLGVTNVDIEQAIVVKYGLQELTIYDPIASQNNPIVTTETPRADIFAFGVMSNKSTVAFDTNSGLVSHPGVYTLAPDPAFVTMAAKVLADQTELGGVAEQFEKLSLVDSKYDKYIDDNS